MDTYTTPNDKVAKVRGDGVKIGPAITLKVMAGDKVNVRVNSWYKLNGVTPNPPVNPLTDIVTALSSGIGTVAGGKITATELTSSGVLTPNATAFLKSRTGDTITKPKAFLNWLLLDEQFHYVSSSSGAEQVGSDQELKTHLKNNLPIDKNGYLYIYVSNETPNIDVFFDNLQVSHVRGPLLEETHYYPFGLTMAGISSRSAGGMENKKKYNGIELENDLELQTYEAQFRELDPQVGRWWQVDPKTENMEMWSPFASNYDNPLRYSDPLGDEGQECCWGEIKQFTKDVVTVSVGVANAWTTNQVGGIGRSDANSVGFSTRDAQLFQAGQTAGDWLTLGTATLEVVIGGGGEIASLGIATPIAVPLATHGAAVAGPAAVRNLINDRVNSKAQERADKLSQKERPGQNMTKAGKEAVVDLNKEKNNGATVCENCGQQTQPAQQHKKGVAPPANETHVDHVNPRSNGGSGTPDNGQVLCRGCNLDKSNKPPNQQK